MTMELIQLSSIMAYVSQSTGSLTEGFLLGDSMPCRSQYSTLHCLLSPLKCSKENSILSFFSFDFSLNYGRRLEATVDRRKGVSRPLGRLVKNKQHARTPQKLLNMRTLFSTSISSMFLLPYPSQYRPLHLYSLRSICRHQQRSKALHLQQKVGFILPT